MHNESTNLLPSERTRALTREYYLRLGVVSITLASALIFISAVLLLPTYIFLVKNESAKQVRLANIESTLSSADEKKLSERLTALTNNAALLIAFADMPSASTIIRTVLAVSRPGTILSSFTYTPAAKNVPGTLAVSGTAATRDALRNYQLALESAPFARSATLPVSAYAKDTNIAFTIVITLSP